MRGRRRTNSSLRRRYKVEDGMEVCPGDIVFLPSAYRLGHRWTGNAIDEGNDRQCRMVDAPFGFC